MKIIFATHNQGKVEELREIFADTNAEILSMEDVGITEDPVEDGNTFEENATKKAVFVSEKMEQKDWVIGDDSGVCIKALGGAPGVFSARWIGEGVPGEKIAAYTLARLRGVPSDERSAYFECAMVLVFPDGRRVAFSGKIDGLITEEARGEAHPQLPYDTIFAPDGFDGKTFAELPDDVKNAVSHRARAAEQVQSFLIERGVLHSSEE